MTDFKGMTEDELIRHREANNNSDGDAAATELTRRLYVSTQELRVTTEALRSEMQVSGATLVRLTTWLVVFTVVLAAVGVVTLVVLIAQA